MSARERHDEADTTLIEIERSDAIDAAGALLIAAREARRQARSRRYKGPTFAAMRAGMRATADVYEHAARRVQHAADAAL